MAELRKLGRRAAAVPLLTAEDVLFVLKFPLLLAASLLVPERHWRSLSRGIERLFSPFSRGRLHRTARGLAMLGMEARVDPVSVLASQTEQNIGILRDWLVGWSPSIDLVGAEHLAAAQTMGHGAVLWIAHFSFNSLAGKIGLARAGYLVHHVSRPEHGFSKSRFGMRVLNPLRVASELRYLAGRIVIDRDKPAASMAEALQLLKQNRCVSITAGAWEGQLIATAPLAGTAGDDVAAIDLATGAPRLAHVAGAPLLPVFVVRDEETGRFLVVVESALALPTGGERTALIDAAVQQFMQRHAPYLARNACQWREWEKVRPLAPKGDGASPA